MENIYSAYIKDTSIKIACIRSTCVVDVVIVDFSKMHLQHFQFFKIGDL